MESRHDTFVHIAADRGPLMGALFCAAMFCGLYAVRLPLLALPAVASALAVPVVLYRNLLSTWRRSHGLATYSMLWMRGIVLFLCGSILLAAAVYVFFRWIEPDFMVSQLEQLADFYSSIDTDAARENHHRLRTIINGGILPGASETALQMIWLGVFTGSMASMLLAALVRTRPATGVTSRNSTPCNNE